MKKKISHPNKVGVVGRKPMPEGTKKKPITCYLPENEIKLIGGFDAARTIALNALNDKVKIALK